MTLALAQLYRRDVPDLPAGPGDCDLLQVFWCPFDQHGPSGYGMALDLRWRRSWEVAEVLAMPPQPQPQLVGSEGYVPEPCVLHPEQVVTYPFAGLLPEDLRAGCGSACRDGGPAWGTVNKARPWTTRRGRSR